MNFRAICNAIAGKNLKNLKIKQLLVNNID